MLFTLIILAIMALHFYHVIYIDSIYYDGVIFFYLLFTHDNIDYVGLTSGLRH